MFRACPIWAIIHLVFVIGGFSRHVFAEEALTKIILHDGDCVGIIGNGLADRMQHDGWVETLLQSKLAGKKVRFRNLAVAGDTVGSSPRTLNTPPPDEYLA
ncbi:MAG: hypothetical protein ACO3RV_08015, partial [Luteolibacter sp.]